MLVCRNRADDRRTKLRDETSFVTGGNIIRDPRIEAALNSNPNIAWEYVDSLGIHNIDEKKSFTNQARIIQQVDRELVTQYQNAWRAGDRFPAITVYEDRPGTYVTVDGNHRYAMYMQEKVATTDAYVVTTENPLERIALTFELNTLNGRPTSEEDRAAQAVSLVNQGFARGVIANRLHVSIKFVEESVHDYTGMERSRRLGVTSPWSKIQAKGVRTRLVSTLPMDKVFALAVTYCGRFNPKVRDLVSILAEVSKLPSEGEQVTYIKNLTTAATKAAEDAKKDTSGRRHHAGPPPNVLFDAHLSYFLSKKVDFTTVFNAMTSEERETEAKKIATVVNRLTDLAEILNA